VEQAYKDALNVFRRQAETNAAYLPKVAETLNDLGFLYLDTQKLDDAERIFREALAIGHQLSIGESPEHNDILAQTLVSLSQTVFEKKGANLGSCDFMREAQEKTLSGDLKKEAQEFLDKNCK